MRELKFRAYIKPLKRYATGLDTIQFHKCCDVAGAGIWTVVTMNEGIFEGDDIIIEQDTGLKDINGVEICEGDILEDGEGEPFEYWVVKFEYGKFTGSTQGVSEDIFELTDLEVIGNINENQDLLGDTNVTNKEEE